MTSSRRTCAGFTLLEVLAAVLIFGIVFTVLAETAIIGLRSEGVDRRRAEASLIADRELVTLESLLATGTILETGLAEREEEPYRIIVEVLPEDVLALLPVLLREEIARDGNTDLETMLVDDRGESRVQRLRVVVEWDEAGEPHQVERITWNLDASDLAALFPPEDEPGAGGAEDGAEPREPSLSEQLGGDLPPELQQLLDQEEGR